MFTPPKFRRPAPAVLLGLGLLGLLLWGQCGLLKEDQKIEPGVYAYVFQVDSLFAPNANQPATLHMTLNLDNELGQPVRLKWVRGEVSFEGRHWPFSATAQLPDSVLVNHKRFLVPITFPIKTPPDSLEPVRAILREGSKGNNSLRLVLKVGYSTLSEPIRMDTVLGTEYLPRSY